MVEGHCSERWDHTSAVLATLAEVNRNVKKRRQPYKATEFHPYRIRARKELPKAKAPIDVLKCFLPQGKHGQQSQRRRSVRPSQRR